jgi:hypothetical protein
VAVLYAKIDGAWVAVGGGGGSEEVFVGPNDPGAGYDLWYDTDAVPQIVTTWTTLPLLNSWVSYGAGYVPQYRKIGDNVQIRGLAKDGAATGSLFQLPVGFRPAYEETFIVWNNGAPHAFSISVAGLASLQAGFVTGYTYLTGVIFSTVP